MISDATITTCAPSTNEEHCFAHHMLLARGGSFHIAPYLVQGIARLPVFAEALVNRLEVREKQRNLPQSGN